MFDLLSHELAVTRKSASQIEGVWRLHIVESWMTVHNEGSGFEYRPIL